jgi:hypothetical protein
MEEPSNSSEDERRFRDMKRLALRYKIKRRKDFIKESKCFLALVMLTIGISGTISFYEYNVLRADYLRAIEIMQTIERHGGVVENSEAQADDEGADPQVNLDEREEDTTPLSVEGAIRQIANEEGFEDEDLLVRIAHCESTLNPEATNPTSSATGLFQILDMHGLTVEERMDVETSTRWTIDHIESGKLNAWNASRNCWNIG